MKKGFYTICTKSMSDYGVVNHKELWEKVKADGYRGFQTTVKTVFDKSVESPYYHATFSSPNEDRHGDFVMQVFDIKAYLNNPVYLDSHNYDSIEHIIGKVHTINTNGGNLNGDVEFCLDNPKGVLAEKMVAKGFLNTSSIGFIPKVFDNDGRILESELLEISAVSVPANEDAIFGKKLEVESKTEEVVDIEVRAMDKTEKRKNMLKAVAQLSENKEKNYQLIVKLARELAIDGKKDRSRRLHQVVEALSK